MANRRGVAARPPSSEEMQWWSACAESLRQISAAYSSEETVELIGKINRLISGWPQDDVLPAEGIDGVRNVYKKLASGLKEIKDSAERDAKSIDKALEPLSVLIALRKATQETTPPDKRAKRPRLASPSTTTTPAAAATPALSTGRGTSIVVQPRVSVGPQPQQQLQPPQQQQSQPVQQQQQAQSLGSQLQVPFSREPKARREALAKQLPLEKGRKVAFHPPQNTKGGEGLTGGKDEEWILAVVTKCINQDKNRYEVQDPEPQEDGQAGQCYNTTLRAIIPLPDPTSPPDSAAHPNAYPAFSAGSTVMALYPDTSCFYRAEVIESPRDIAASNRGGPGSKHAVPMYRLKFEDDDDQEHLVQSQWVVEWPGGT